MTDHFREAERKLAFADDVLNRDNWIGDRQRDADIALAQAQAHATLALAVATTEAARVEAKAIYDGRI